MGLFDFVKKQFIDVIHWTEEGDGVLAYRYPMQDFEIQNGAQLTVRDSQLALFVNEGQVADAFQPGLYTLNTQTLPVLTNLKNWDKLFDSPFKSDVYFFSSRLQLDRKWGTPNPITLRDPEFGMVRLRAFGIYSYKIVDPAVFYKEVSGTREIYSVDDLDGQLRNTIIGSLTDAVASAGIAFVDLAANQEEIGAKLKTAMEPVFARYGLALDSFVVQNVSLPEELQKILDQRISMNVIGDMNKYTQFNVAQSIPLAAQNEGGMAGIGAGVGAGIGMGQAMAAAVGQAMGGAGAAPQAGAPAEDPLALIEKLHGLKEKGILSEEEFAAKKAELLKKLV
ncbi:Membrane protease subunit, stomatin/prohibitin family, contains C-terminal Zn-ribbon domain [Formivibrio citricus]|uniref:Membrane protease subunit, stomatin/prohibitin family, contains C-terminal Zn-ribbon domain n=1 Tax=Formivibrio citricus TaxID=83765 RepID=A0A1I4W100_9NEIS|nr:SPFH domain-containing protein [Formivibrio citricus]SFN06997.1 Membrane protease subunit, stomatin/prohibitin family, contains C-terminal Zn-ribbon domain [Formivibrio citricus]